MKAIGEMCFFVEYGKLAVFLGPVQRHQHHLIIVIENVLGSITLMDIPIEDQNLVSLQSCSLSCNGNVVKETKAC